MCDLKSFDSIASSLSLAFLHPLPYLYMLTAQVRYKLKPIQYFMNAQEVDCHCIHKAHVNKVITLPHVTTDLQVVDFFTKALPFVTYQFFVNKLMLVEGVGMWGQNELTLAVDLSSI